MPVFGNVFGMDKYKQENNRYSSFTFKDNHKLQVLQNKLNRLLLNADYNTPTAELLKRTDSLSIQQMIAYQTAVAAHKIIKSNKPKYIASKMKVKEVSLNLRGRKGSVKQAGYSLSIAKEGFIYRGSQIINRLENSLRNEENIEKFKAGTRNWVMKNIDIKPSSKYPNLNFGMKTRQPEPPPDPQEPAPYDIRRYFVPRVTNTATT